MIYYTLDEPTEGGGIFLAGPSLRPEQKGTSWRPDAIQRIKQLKINPTIYVPEFKPILVPNYRQGEAPENWTYEKQVEWEVKCLFLAQTILFWIPRSFETPGFTTNIEFGEWLHSDKIVIGWPKHADRMDYIAHRCKMRGMYIHHNLNTLCEEAVEHNRKRNAIQRNH